MGKRKDLKKVVLLGSGPINIGQACEFDYSGTQACKALMAEGLEVILINSNPATIMTDVEVATRVYVEPLKIPFVKKILEKEKPDALIPTLGGQTALNLALDLEKEGILKELNIELLGAKVKTIEAAEDRAKFSKVLDDVGAKYPKSIMVKTFEQGLSAAEELGFPIILRPNYTLGGGGGGVAYSMEEYKVRLATALHESPTSEVLVDESILGWKEYELEVIRDKDGTFVVICSIENIDACGVHTGDSITVAPQQTLSDREYQDMRDEAQKIINAVGVETGGANVQFAVDPKTKERVVIEMNPRVSRSSALASKATGFPIAKIAALLAIGYTLDELKNDITGTTLSCYEPALDYVVTKVPKFSFEKFPGAKDVLSTQMKSIGEVMGIGRTFKESFQKCFLGLENGDSLMTPRALDEKKISYPNSERMYYLFQALREGYTVERLAEMTLINEWYLEQFEDIARMENDLKTNELNAETLKKAKRLGFSDSSISTLVHRSEIEIRELRHKNNIRPKFYKVDTCAAEFKSETPYFYSTYWSEPDPVQQNPDTILLLGSGPNRIGQGIEFDYSCVRSVKEFQRQGFKVAMLNSNPETVSTDYDTSDSLYFEALHEETILEILFQLNPKGFVSQLGGQTPINIAPKLIEAGFNMLGSSLDSMDLAEDRGRFIQICKEFGFKIPRSGMASGLEVALENMKHIGYPAICRPSYVLGGRRMEIVEDEKELISYFHRHKNFISEKSPCLMDQFLDRALEVDVDLVRGPDWTVVGGVIEHIEAAGVHSGDSMGVIPPQRLKEETCEKLQKLSVSLAEQLNILGFLNLQLAIKEDQIYMIEANPRSSRSVPFMAKATGVPLVNLGVKAMLGLTKDKVQPEKYKWNRGQKTAVKGVVFPFKKFLESDSILGPEMKSTGESMGRGSNYSEALLKALVSSRFELPLKGEVFLSLRDKDKEELLPAAKELEKMGYSLSATGGTAQFLSDNGVSCLKIKKVHEGRPNCVDRIQSGEVAFVINTTSGKQSVEASFGIRQSCTVYSVPCLTESDAANAFLLALKKHKEGDFEVYPLEPMVK